MDISSIMVVDDSESDQFLTEAVINAFDESIEIFQAYDGQEALEQLDNMTSPPNIILLDINMPRMNGFEFLEEYSKRDYETKVIAMLTSSDQEQDKEKALQYGCIQEYFVKPMDAFQLEKIRNLPD